MLPPAPRVPEIVIVYVPVVVLVPVETVSVDVKGGVPEVGERDAEVFPPETDEDVTRVTVAGKYGFGATLIVNVAVWVWYTVTDDGDTVKEYFASKTVRLMEAVCVLPEPVAVTVIV